MTKQGNWIFLGAALLHGGMTQASELDIPNEFSSGTPAIAAEVNANFSATETAVNDNDSRISTLEATVSELASQLAAVQVAQEQIQYSVEQFYAGDLFFMMPNGTLIIPNASGNESPPSSINTGYDFVAMPGQENIAFDVVEDDTTVLVNSVGEAYLNTFSAYAGLTIAIGINGSIPALGGVQGLAFVSDNTVSGDLRNWDLTVPVQLDAGTHTFTVYLKGTAQNEGEIAFDGRLTGNLFQEGRIRTTVTQIKLP